MSQPEPAEGDEENPLPETGDGGAAEGTLAPQVKQ